MKILVASSEVTPFAKTGGLADVCGALPRELDALGHDVSVIMPAFRSTFDAAPYEDTGHKFNFEIANRTVTGRLLRSALPGSQIPVYLVEQADYFARPQLYGEDGSDYDDNSERFIFFCRAVLDSARDLGWQPDVIHCNDWQTGLIPAYLHAGVGYESLERTATLLTIHNLAYQGSFWHWDMLLTGIDWKYFNWQQMEFFGNLNFLKTGIVFADALNTVSQKYSEEIQDPELGFGLDGVLRSRRDALTGIANGIDTNEWNPETDRHLPTTYSVESWLKGKRECKLALLKQNGLSTEESRPLIGLVGRLADQKGWSLIIDVMREWLNHIDASWIILGTGQPEYHQSLAELAAAYPEKLAVRLGFSDAMAHQIEAGADMFLMPSRYEPCGLNQLYSMKYGTIPIVHDTGGLSDTIVDASPVNLANGTATGFKFGPFTDENLESSLATAVRMYLNDKTAWKQMVETGMNQDWSWKKSAEKYVALYRSTIENKTKHSQPA